MKEEESGEKAFRFIADVYSKLADDEKVTVDHVRKVFGRKNVDFDEIVGEHSEYDSERSGSSFLKSTGILLINLIFFGLFPYKVSLILLLFVYIFSNEFLFLLTIKCY